MPTSITNIVFKARVFDASNKLVAKASFAIEMYFASSNRWIRVQTNTNATGSVTFNFSLGATNKSIYKKTILEILNLGTIPPFRLVSGTNTVALAKDFALDATKKVLTVNFGDNWLVDASKKTLINSYALNFNALNLNDEKEIEKSDKFKKLDVTNKNLESQLKIKTEQLINLEKEKNTAITNATKAKDLEIQRLNNQLTLKDAKIKETEKNKDNLINQLSRDKESTILQLQKDIQKAQLNIGTKDSKIKELQEMLDKGTTDTKAVKLAKVPLTTFSNQVVNDMSKVKKELSNSDFKISNIQLKLKTIVTQEDDDLKLQLMDAASERINGNMISDLIINIDDSVLQSQNDLVIPSVLGLTESAARTVLARYQLKLEPVYQAVDAQSTKYTIGQAFKQYPAAGSTALKNSTINVIFAKNQNEQN